MGKRGSHRGRGFRGTGHVQTQRQSLLRRLCHNVRELRWVTRRGHDVLPLPQRTDGESAAEQPLVAPVMN